MLIKIKSKNTCLKIAKKEYEKSFGPSASVSENKLLDCLPDDIFNSIFDIDYEDFDPVNDIYYVSKLKYVVRGCFVEPFSYNN